MGACKDVWDDVRLVGDLVVVGLAALIDIGDSGAVVDIDGIGRPPYVAGRGVDADGECSSLVSSKEGGGGLMAHEPEEVS